MEKRGNYVFILSLVVLFLSCKKDDSSSSNTSNTKDSDSNFTVVSHSDDGFSSLPKKVMVMGIPIYGATGVESAKMLHAANVMAQYLDNDEDGVVDNQSVLDKMIANKSFLVMWKNESDLDNVPFTQYGQDLGNDETVPAWHTNGQIGRFDASLEEVLHLITHTGYAEVYPSVFGEAKGSEIADAMDVARGGQFDDIPSTYPSSAWYTYDDNTCDYSCQVTEYTYWAITSYLGAQTNRLDEIGHEWKLNTADKLKTTDSKVHEIIIKSEYKLPTKLPNGTYRLK